MRSSSHRTAALFALSLLPLGAQGGALVRGDGFVLTDMDVRAEIAFQPEQIRSRYHGSAEALTALIDDLYRRKVLAAAAARLDLTEDERYRLERARKEELVAIAIDRKANELLSAAPSFEERAAELYQSNRDQFMVPEAVHVRHILYRVGAGSPAEAQREKAAAVLTRLKAGESFEQLARSESEDPASARQGGNLGWIERGRTVAPFQAAAFALDDPGSLSGIVETQFGFHIIQLVERRDASVQPFEEVKERLIAAARADYIKAELQRWQAEVTDPKSADVDAEALKAFIEKTLAKPGADSRAGKE